MTDARRRPVDKPWALPLLSLVLAVIAFLIAWLGTGDLVLASSVAGVMVVYAAVLRLGGRSETVRILRGETEDERAATIDTSASVWSLWAVIIVALIGGGFELARGEPGPFTLVAFVGGTSYMIALAVLRRRM